MAHSIIINAPVQFSLPVTFENPRPYTVMEWADNAIITRLNSVNTLYPPLSYKRVFSEQNTTNNYNLSTWTYNLSSWTYNLRQQLTCASPWNIVDGSRRAGTLITPRHIILAAHYALPGGVLRFITTDNQIVERTIVQIREHPDRNPVTYYADIVMCLLDSDVPDTISYCYLLPSNYQEYFTTSSLSAFTVESRCGVFYLDQEGKASVTDLYGFSSNQVITIPPTNSVKLSAYEEAVPGDSGKPVFIIIDDKLVLLTTLAFADIRGPDLAFFVPSINDLIQTLDTSYGIDTGYRVTTYNLSNYRSLTAN